MMCSAQNEIPDEAGAYADWCITNIQARNAPSPPRDILSLTRTPLRNQDLDDEWNEGEANDEANMAGPSNQRIEVGIEEPREDDDDHASIANEAAQELDAE